MPSHLDTLSVGNLYGSFTVGFFFFFLDARRLLACEAVCFLSSCLNKTIPWLKFVLAISNPKINKTLYPARRWRLGYFSLAYLIDFRMIKLYLLPVKYGRGSISLQFPVTYQFV